MALDGEIKKPGNQARICYQPPPIKKWSLYFHPLNLMALNLVSVNGMQK